MSIDFEQLKAMNAVAVGHSIDLVRHATVADLSRPTPCAAWTLSDLLAHMSAQHRGFAASAAGGGQDLADWSWQAQGDDTVAQYTAAAERVLTAFAAVETPAAPFALPELTTVRTLPAGLAIGFHLIDYAVHSWDVAATLGVAFDPAPDLLDAALPIALAVPDGPLRLDPGSAFGPSLAMPTGARAMDQILAMLGRSPSWHASTAPDS
jgi:uncharacterized protein (TIGR03086 family)